MSNELFQQELVDRLIKWYVAMGNAKPKSAGAHVEFLIERELIHGALNQWVHQGHLPQWVFEPYGFKNVPKRARVNFRARLIHFLNSESDCEF